MTQSSIVKILKSYKYQENIFTAWCYASAASAKLIPSVCLSHISCALSKMAKPLNWTFFHYAVCPTFYFSHTRYFGQKNFKYTNCFTVKQFNNYSNGSRFSQLIIKIKPIHLWTVFYCETIRILEIRIIETPTVFTTWNLCSMWYKTKDRKWEESLPWNAIKTNVYICSATTS